LLGIDFEAAGNTLAAFFLRTAQYHEIVSLTAQIGTQLNDLR
jgi:hypothetical protein